jgi:hypothetical protein
MNGARGERNRTSHPKLAGHSVVNFDPIARDLSLRAASSSAVATIFGAISSPA